MSPDDVRVTRALLAHAKAQGWKRNPIDITVDGDHDGTYHNYTWSTMDLRICVVALLLEQREPDWPTDWWVNVFDNNGPGAGIRLPTSAQQVADLLAAVGLVPVELTSGWAAGRMAMAAELSEALLALRDRFHNKERETGRPDYKGRARGFETAAALARMAGGDVW